MKKKVSSQSLIFIISIFICGIIAGIFCAMNLPETGKVLGLRLSEFYIQNMQDTVMNLKTFVMDLLNNFKYFILIILALITPFSSVLVPLIISFRGFLLAFSTYTIIKNMGMNGLITSFINLPMMILSLCSIFILGSICIDYAGLNNKRKKMSHIFGGEMKFIIFLFLCASIYESFISPLLISIIY